MGIRTMRHERHDSSEQQCRDSRVRHPPLNKPAGPEKREVGTFEKADEVEKEGPCREALAP